MQSIAISAKLRVMLLRKLVRDWAMFARSIFSLPAQSRVDKSCQKHADWNRVSGGFISENPGMASKFQRKKIVKVAFVGVTAI
jgi:hypothetical protein